METAVEPILLSTERAAKLLDVSANTLREWRKAGCPHLMVGNRPRYFLSVLVEWLKDRQVAAVTD